ncbi:helix-turn-helix transcriptional regulator [Kitasatospora phosalacinea]|uniref:Transcriptional regulator n=1 Tax=Kitasatospora phosalacinea TaxID=2065 RepID=A0A9W6PHD7_9ACTN|nr:LuxR family transcriptional regulator [Kitasatospora phosalacinea]GLW55146.1 transcriptional regulator [Kitasatospora phosalacinea]
MPDSATQLSVFQEPVGTVLPALPDGVPGARRVVLFGPPGIGRTTAAGILARRLGLPVLRLAPGPQDAPVPWTGLLELALALQPLPAARELAAAVDEAADSEPAGASLRLRRLTTALLREIPPLTLVVDNAQWLDPASAAVLRWALRLTPDLPVIATERTWRPGTEGYWSGEDVHAVRVPPLTAHQLSALLSARRPTHGQVARIHRRSGGNPALALALADAADPVADRDGDDEAALPPAARRVVGEWLDSVSEEARDLLTLAALDDRPDRKLLARLVGPAAGHLLAEAEAAGLVDLEHADGSVHFTASAIGVELTVALTDTARRLLHARLAEASHDHLRRDRHTALAADADDPRTADDAARAAVSARLRGEHALAAELSLLAAQRTPKEDTGLLTERALTAARDAAHYGDLHRGRTAARLVLAHDTSPARRVDTLLALIDASGQHLNTADHLFADALNAAAGRPDLAPQVLIRQSIWANVNDGDPHKACALAEQAAILAESTADSAAGAMALTLQARFQRILGHPAAGTTLARALSLPHDPHTPANGTPQHLAARHALFDDRPDRARTLLLPLLVEAERTNDAEATVDILRSLAETELRAGRCARALEHARRAQALTDRTALSPAPACYTSALVEGTAHNTDAALAHAQRGIDTARHEDNKVFLSRNLYALGHILLAAGRPQEALEALEEVRTLEEQQQVRDPSVLRWHPDLAEALIAHGRLDEADVLLTDTRRTATDLGRTSALPALDRSQALLDAARGNHDTAARRLTETADRLHHLPLEHARTLLALSHTERRARRRASARTAAQSATDLFTTHHAHPWTDTAQRTLHHLTHNPPGHHTGPLLTPAEQRCAQLAATGASNRDIAATLTVSTKTVEATLTRVYRKLGLHSRAQLAHTLATAQETPAGMLHHQDRSNNDAWP